MFRLKDGKLIITGKKDNALVDRLCKSKKLSPTQVIVLALESVMKAEEEALAKRYKNYERLPKGKK